MRVISAFRSRIASGPLFVLGILLFAGCQSNSESGNAGIGSVHPQEAFLPYSDEVDHTIGREPPEGGLLADLTTALATPVDTLGVRAKSGPELFGRVSDVVQDAQERILILDREHSEVRMFNSDGAFVGSFGEAGEGPGEFRAPNRLALFENGDLLITDRLGRVQLFSPAGSTYERTGGFRVEFTPEDVCTQDSRIYLQGFTAGRAEHSIHAYTRQGEHVRSLEPVYDTPDEFVRSQMTRGTIACDRAEGVIAFAFTYSPLVYGFAPTGDLRWTTQLTQLSVTPVEYVRKQGKRGLVYRQSPEEGFVTALTDVPGPGLLLQELQYPPEEEAQSNGGGHAIHTYWLSASEGTGGYVGSAAREGRFPAIVYSVTQERLLWAHQSPFPAVEVYSVSEVSWSTLASRRKRD